MIIELESGFECVEPARVEVAHCSDGTRVLFEQRSIDDCDNIVEDVVSIKLEEVDKLIEFLLREKERLL